MKVKELIEKLKELDENTEVFIGSSVEGFHHVSVLQETEMVLNCYNAHWMGEHDELEIIKRYADDEELKKLKEYKRVKGIIVR